MSADSHRTGERRNGPGVALLRADIEFDRQSGFRLQARLDCLSQRASKPVGESQPPGEPAPPCLAIYGPSGSGKTTLLRCLAGLENPTAGVIRFGNSTWFDDRMRVNLNPATRRVGVMFQDDALFPRHTVAENVAFGLAGQPRSLREASIRQLLDELQLAGLERRRPDELSAGQRQRVALARALAAKPSLLLLDEPLAALDPITRRIARTQLRQWLARYQIPSILVTHELDDVYALADELLILAGGRALQLGETVNVRRRPQSLAVAEILGIENRLAGFLETNSAGQTTFISQTDPTVRWGGLRLVASSGEWAADPETGHADRPLMRPENSSLTLIPAGAGWLVCGAGELRLSGGTVLDRAGGPAATACSASGIIGAVEVWGDQLRVVVKTPLPLVIRLSAAEWSAGTFAVGQAVTVQFPTTAMTWIPSH